jgi:uncharacterized protein (DUF608 family)
MFKFNRENFIALIYRNKKLTDDNRKLREEITKLHKAIEKLKNQIMS